MQPDSPDTPTYANLYVVERGVLTRYPPVNYTLGSAHGIAAEAQRNGTPSGRQLN